MTLGELLNGVDCEILNAEKAVTGITVDSRSVKEGFVFFALKGEKVDGLDFVKKAIQSGASVIVTDRKVIVHGVKVVVVKDVEKTFSKCAANFYKNPSQRLKGCAVTGTNGKTTTAYLIEAALKSKGLKVGIMGTIAYKYFNKEIEAPLTTPMADRVCSFLKDMADDGVTHFVMETSSHGLSRHRVDFVNFDAKVFTNLSQDHMDYHKTMDDYFEAKARLFKDPVFGTGKSVINIDDEWGKILASDEDVKDKFTYSTNDESADIHPKTVDIFEGGIKATISTPIGDIQINSNLMGDYNLMNIMASIGALIAFGLTQDEIAEGINTLKAVPGRLEEVTVEGSENRVRVFVDYAHTDDALRRVLKTLKNSVKGRLICVFGCGGDRDKGKRPLMGKAAMEESDIGILTSDNPRTEDPMAIINDIREGVKDYREIEKTEKFGTDNFMIVELDRKKAIELAITNANDGDTVLIAGKGHEDYQIIGTEKIDFDDRVVAREILAKK